MHAYAETYLPGAMRNLGEAVDYAVNDCSFSADEFAEHFVTSGLAAEWEGGSARVLAGLSGIELTRDSFRRTGIHRDWPTPAPRYELSPQYWAGWALTYYQWWSARSFGSIFERASISEVIAMYPALHEASENRFVDRMEERFRGATSLLKCWRERRGCSQSELERISGVKIRNIRLYEQHPEAMVKAEYRTVKLLAHALGCRPDDLVVLPAELTR